MDDGFVWRHALSAVKTIEADAFAELVLENDLRVVGPYRGYVYAALPGENGFDLYKAYQAKKWIWQSRIRYTQTNAAGGAVKADYSVATGQIARLISAHCVNSGTNGIAILGYDEDNAAYARFAVIGSGAGTTAYIPSIGAAATSSNNTQHSLGFLIAPGTKLSFEQTGAGAQNDTFDVAVVLELFNLATEPTISKSRSVNAADVTQGTDSISDTNDLQEFVC